MNFAGFTFGDPAFVWLLRTEKVWRRALGDEWILRCLGPGDLRLYTAQGVS